MNSDARHLIATSLILLAVGSPLMAQEFWVQYRPEIRDLADTPIDTIGTNEDFWLYVLVSDVRPEPTSVFAAYTDVTYDAGLVSAVTGEVDHLDRYSGLPHGDAMTPGLVNEAGGIGPISYDDGAEFDVFRVLMRSGDELGKLTFATDPADDQIQRATLLLLLDDTVPVDLLDQQSVGLTIIPEPASWLMLVLGLIPLRRVVLGRSG